MTPFEQGSWAADCGHPASENPYEIHSQEWKDWADGWMQQNHAIIDGENWQAIADGE